MGWSHEDSWEVGLVLRVLEHLRVRTLSIDPETGDVLHGLDFTREWTIPKIWRARFKRFDFAVWTDGESFECTEFLIEVHGKQHNELSSLGDKVAEADRLKSDWGKANKIPLLVLPQREVLSLHLDGKLTTRICKFLRILP